MATCGHFGHSGQSGVSGNGPNRFPMPTNLGMDTRIKSIALSKPHLQWRGSVHPPLSGPLFLRQMATFGDPGQSGTSENGPNGFPMPENLGMDTKIKSLALSKPKLHFVAIFGVLGAKFCTPSSFFYFFGVQSRFGHIYEYVLWTAIKNRWSSLFKVPPRPSGRSLMSQTFMTLFFTKFQHTRFILQFRLSKIFFFRKSRPPF